MTGSKPLINLNLWPSSSCPQKATFKYSAFLLLCFFFLVCLTLDAGEGLSITYTQTLQNLAYGIRLSLGNIRRSKLRTDVQGLELPERRDYQAQPQVAMAMNSHLPLSRGRVREGTERTIELVLQDSGLGVREDLAEVRASLCPTWCPQNWLCPLGLSPLWLDSPIPRAPGWLSG